MPISRYTSNAFWPLFFHLVDQIWCSQSLQPDFLLLRRVCEVLVAFWPDLVGQNGRRSKMANFGYTPVLALYSKTSGALCHPLKSFFLKFFGIFTFVMVNVTWKTCGWLNFQKSWHLNHPNVVGLWEFCRKICFKRIWQELCKTWLLGQKNRQLGQISDVTGSEKVPVLGGPGTPPRDPRLTSQKSM